MCNKYHGSHDVNQLYISLFIYISGGDKIYLPIIVIYATSLIDHIKYLKWKILKYI